MNATSKGPEIIPYTAIPTVLPFSFYSTNKFKRPAAPSSIQRPINTIIVPTHTTHRPSNESTYISKTGLNPDNTRTWTDKSGTFRVEAECTDVLDGKVYLLKENGVTITVPLEKLNPLDVAFLKTVPDFLVQIEKFITPPIRGYVVDGFDWKAFLLAAGIDEKSAELYSVKFCDERIDKDIVRSMDRSVLKDLGLKEGDVVRLTRALGVGEISTDMPSSVQKLIGKSQFNVSSLIIFFHSFSFNRVIRPSIFQDPIQSNKIDSVIAK